MIAYNLGFVSEGHRAVGFTATQFIGLKRDCSMTHRSSAPTTKQIGNQGEQTAAHHLERLGWQILARNFRCRFGEIDIIAEEATPSGKILAFVEVKTRRGKSHGTPQEAVNPRKQAKLYQIAQAYFAERNRGGEEPACRFDIVEVFLEADGLAGVVLHRAAFMG